MLDLHDVIVGKTRALVDRRAERDYADIDRILASSLRNPLELYEGIKEIRPEVTEFDFAQILDLAHEGDPDEYAALGLTHNERMRLFERLQSAAQTMKAVAVGSSAARYLSRTNPQPAASNTAPTPASAPMRRCCICGRPLRSAESIERGYGPTCALRA